MKAIQVSHPGGPEVLEYVDLPMPEPGPEDVLVRVGATGVNFIDTYQREGRYKRPLPYIPGSEAAGVVEKIGSSVTGFKPGDTVATASGRGTYAEYTTASASKLALVPHGLSLEQAAAAMLQGMTAHYLANTTWPIRKGETVLIHAGAGGVGLLLTQMAVALGATVITTVSTEEKAALSREAGAHHVILYTQQDFQLETRRITSNRGVDVVYDSVGKTTFAQSLASLRPRGMLVLFGGSSGAAPAIDPIELMQKGSLYLTRPTLDHYIASQEEFAWRTGDILQGVAQGRLKLRTEHTWKLKDAAEAHRALEARKTTGKILLVP